ncbi:MAG: CBS domain-containing protein [Nitrospiraceae bacterium]|nr:CBS domain-containing protein [Nitrospiraceae bacterium]
MKAKDVMIPPREHLRTETTLRKAVRLPRSAHGGGTRIGVRELPVIDETGNMLGMLYEQDVYCAVAAAMLDHPCRSGGAR